MKHEEVVQLLPWYINGTLGPPARREVEAHLGDCPTCARELAELGTLREAEVAPDAEEASLPSGSLPRLLRRIEVYEQERQRGWTGRVTEWLAATFAAFAQPWPVAARVVVVAQLALLIGLGVFLDMRTSQQPLVTLSGPGAEASAQATRLLVAFQPGVPEATLRETLVGLQVTIVNGPSAAGFYTLAVPIPPSRKAELEAFLAQLRERRDVIRFVGQVP